MVMAVKERPMQSVPSSAMSGKSLAVLGSLVGAGSVAAVSAGGTGTGRATTTKIGISALGAGGGGGAVPVLWTSCVTTVSGTSVTLCAETVIPFLRPHASVSCPLTMNLWPLGISNL